jgi:hypothetical protein
VENRLTPSTTLVEARVREGERGLGIINCQ